MNTLVSFEGLDGTGKTTLIEKILENWNIQDLKVNLMPEFPEELASSEINKYLKQSLYISESFPYGKRPAFFYMLYARSLCIEKTNNLKGVILADRYLHTMAIYQSYFIHEELEEFQPVEIYKDLYSLFQNLNIPLPKLVFYLDAPNTILYRRLEKREKRAITEREKSILDVIRKGYKNIFNYYNEDIHYLDMTQKTDLLVKKVIKIISSYI